MITFLSSRKSGAVLLTLGILVVEGAFAWLCSRAYGALLSRYMGMWEVQQVLQWVVFLALTVFGFVLAAHRQYGVAAMWERARASGRSEARGVFLVALVVAHDWGAALYTVFGMGQGPTLPLVLVMVGMCGLALMPFLLGPLLLALAE
jgi:hypothetical protein